MQVGVTDIASITAAEAHARIGLAVGRVMLLWVSNKVKFPSYTPSSKFRHFSAQLKLSVARKSPICSGLLGHRDHVRPFAANRHPLNRLTIPRTVCLFWAVPSLVVGALTMFVVGFVLGPVHPIVMDEVGRILPRWLRTGAIGWIGAFGATIAPSVVGYLINFWGTLWFLPL
jgi:hypothetical protein